MQVSTAQGSGIKSVGSTIVHVQDLRAMVMWYGDILGIPTTDLDSINSDRSEYPIKNHINSIVVPITDLKRATEWYGNLLGHAIKPERQDGGPIYWFDMDNGTGILLDDNRNNDDFDKYPTFMLKASHILEAYRYMQNKNVRIVREIEYDHHFFISDPEGNTVIICKG